MATRPDGTLSKDRCADTMFVALESLTKRTPATSPASCMACSSPVNARTAVVMPSGVVSGHAHRRKRHERLIARDAPLNHRIARDRDPIGDLLEAEPSPLRQRS